MGGATTPYGGATTPYGGGVTPAGQMTPGGFGTRINTEGLTPGETTPGEPPLENQFSPNGAGVAGSSVFMTIDVCALCQKDILLTDEYIKLIDCNHIYHRICMIHRVAAATEKKFFLTEDEITDEKSNFHLC